MSDQLKTACDEILGRVTTVKDRVPGVVAMVTDRSVNIYEGATGERILGSGKIMTTDSVFAIFSTTKAIAGTAIMQCVEEGALDLDAPAKKYAPDIGKLQVIDGFDADGKPKLRSPKRDITTRMLMLHTAGLGYDFFNTTYNRLAQEQGQPSVITCSKASIMTPLLFDPGERWEYGSNIDWCGQVVEGIRGKRLGEVLKERVFAPLGMEDIGFSMTPSMKSRLAAIHQREANGSLTPMPDLTLPPNPEVDMGGHGLYASIGEVQDLLKLSVMLCPKAVSPPTSGSPAVEPRLRQPAHCRQDAPRRAREGRWCGLPRVSCRAGLLLWWFDFARAAANVAAALASPIAFLTDANCDADKGFFASATTCNAGSCSLAMAFRAQCFCWHLASCARHLPSLQ